METLNFRDLVKMIHPDTNPGITDPGGKMVTAKRHRDNPPFLFRLAVDWGLVKGNGSYQGKGSSHTTENTNTSSRGAWAGSRDDFVFETGNVVWIRYRTKTRQAVIVDFEPGKGKRKGYHKVLAADISKGQILYFYVRNLNTSMTGNIQVRRPASAYEKVESNQIYWRYQESLKSQKRAKENMKSRREEKVKENLEPNRRYWNRNVWIISKTLSGLFRVVRTTKKRVYYWDEHNQKERFVNMSSVVRVVWREE